jgi:tripartite-type tricarboxylate transporter receptor subunit TctC
LNHTVRWTDAQRVTSIGEYNAAPHAFCRTARMNMNTMQRTRWMAAGLTAVVLTLWVAPAMAQDYPNKSIRLIIPFAPGGTNDVIGRLMAAKLGEILGQQVVPDNRAGAGGTVGIELVVKTPPDGYNLVIGNIATLAINPTLYPKLSYDPLRDLQPVTLIAKVPQVLVAHPSLPAKNARELIALAKSRPGELAYGSGGNGSGAHVSGEMLAKINLTHIPYKGVGPAQIDLLAGQIQLVFAGVPSVVPYVKTGRLRALGITGPKRVVTFPEVPTIAESGVANFDVTMWYGVLAAAGTPQPLVMKLHGAVNRALRAPELNERLLAEGSEPSGILPDEFSAFIKSELTRWAPVIRASGARPD